MDIDILAQTIMCTARVSHPPGGWLLAQTTHNDTTNPDFNNVVIDPDEEVFNLSQNILDIVEPKFYRQAITESNADLWHSAIEAEQDALWLNHI
jgi:hypothetical protein